MPKAIAHLNTEFASRYLKAMCRHFAHKVEVQYDNAQGTAALPDANLVMTANNDALYFEVQADDLQKLLRARYIVDAHIVRFAFREKLMGLDWASSQ